MARMARAVQPWRDQSLDREAVRGEAVLEHHETDGASQDPLTRTARASAPWLSALPPRGSVAVRSC